MYIESIYPSCGPIRGNTNISITGDNFLNQTDEASNLDLKCKFKTSVARNREMQEVAFEDAVYIDTSITHDGTTLYCTV